MKEQSVVKVNVSRAIIRFEIETTNRDVKENRTEKLRYWYRRSDLNSKANGDVTRFLRNLSFFCVASRYEGCELTLKYLTLLFNRKTVQYDSLFLLFNMCSYI